MYKNKKQNMTNTQIEDYITDYAKSIWQAFPEKYITNDYIHYTTILEKLMFYIKKYRATNYIYLDIKLVDKFLNYDRNRIREKIKRDYKKLIKTYINTDFDYYSGMERSKDVDTKDEYEMIYNKSTRRVMEHIMDLTIEAFDNLMIVESLFFFVIAEKYNSIPSKSLFLKYQSAYRSGTIASFIRELKINEILMD